MEKESIRLNKSAGRNYSALNLCSGNFIRLRGIAFIGEVVFHQLLHGHTFMINPPATLALYPMAYSMCLVFLQR
ncbi:putative membrane protein [Paenibacillus sp. DS2015]